MAAISGVLTIDGGQIAGGVLRHRLPVLAYRDAATTEDSTLGIRREVVGELVRDHRFDGAASRWRVDVPGESLIGESVDALRRWAAFATWEELRFDIPWEVADRNGMVVASGAHRALFGFDDTSPDGAAILRDKPNQIGPALRRNVFVLDATAFDALLESIGTVDRDGRWLLQVVARIGRFTLAGVSVPRFSDDDRAGLAERERMTLAELDVILDTWEDLTTFDVAAEAPREMGVAGTLTLVADGGDPPTVDDARGLSITAEADVQTLDDARDGAAWDLPAGWPGGADALPIAFTLESARPIPAGSVRSDVVVRVRASDGAELLRVVHPSDAPALRELDLRVPVDRRPVVGPDAPAEPRTEGGRQLRGQVVRTDGGAVGGLTVLVQTVPEGGAPLPTIFAAATTTSSGSFFTPFPSGEHESVSALVSVAPDSKVDLRLDDAGRVLDDFVYLLVSEEVATATSGGAPARLPGQDDLVRSGEYRQDLGGCCLNVTTPNRSLREYRFNAIVRTSDPEVSSYTLRRGSDGRYVFEGGATAWPRPSIDLTHPVRWQHAPQAGDELSFYQAVTIATGHILWYKSVFKSDGYSLGDLVYSLPLAPGQKKQIVSYDMANTLTASEAQQLAQGERLAASLFDDRMITDEIAGSLDESVSGSSNASTAGVSAGLGLGGSMGPIGGSLGVSGGYSNSRSRASQQGARDIAQSFGEKLRQSLIQQSESYRRLNASVVQQVKEGQSYSVTTEVVANHNHCHSLTMMYFEVLRHYAVSQELSEVQECVFVPLQLTEFSPESIARWKDVLAPALLPVPSSTSVGPFVMLGRRRGHPLARAFDANDRVLSDWAHVDYPENSYAEDPIEEVEGSIRLRVSLPRPRTRADRIMSLPVITETVVSREVDTLATVAGAILTGGLSLLGGASTRTREETVQARKDVSDAFLQLDANYRDVPPARSIRVTSFEPRTFEIGGETITLDFFGNDTDRDQWTAYARLLGYTEAWELLQQFFAGNLISEWDTIFNRDIAPLLWDAIVESIAFAPSGGGSGLSLDLTSAERYRGGDRRMTLRARGGAHPERDAIAPSLRISSTSARARALRDFTTVIVQDVSLSYTTAHHSGPMHRGYVGDDLLDATGTLLSIPLTRRDRRNPRDEDRRLQADLVDHLNASIEHYNTALWTKLDANRRFMLLDGFSIDTYERDGSPAGRRSLASVVDNSLIAIAGNALVLPVADGYHVSRSLLVEDGDDAESDQADRRGLRARYEPLEAVEPYRLSVPTRGVYAEAVMGDCDSCEEVKLNSSQDWNLFRTDEPTAIAAVTTPTPQRTDWKAIWAQFASPLVGMQTAREAPAPGAGLAGVSDALTKAGAFQDVTGLAANQENAIRTYLSNQENARAFAEMARGLAMQEHNTSNSRSIMSSLDSARDSGAITDDDHHALVRDHLSQVVDGGQRQEREAEAAEAREPSLESAGIEAVRSGRDVRATTRSSDGTEQSLEVGGDAPSGSAIAAISYAVPLVAQPNKTACWAASMAMLESFRRSLDTSSSRVVSAGELADEVGYTLDQSYGWDRLEDVRRFLDLDDIDGLSLQQHPTPQQWAQWLGEYGPLYVTVDGAPTHAIVVRGIAGDGTAAGTSLELLNPWDTSTAFDSDPTEFHPPNTGLSTTMTVQDLNQRFNGGQLGTLEFYSRWRVLFSTPVRAHLRAGTVAPSGQASGGTCWAVDAGDLATEAAAEAVRQYTTWSTGGLTETDATGRTLVEEYWRSVAAAFPGVSQAWSAVFISWLMTRAYASLAPAGTTVGGAALADYATLGDAAHDSIMSRANNCLIDQALFNTNANHYRYVVTTRNLTGTTARVLDPAVTELQVGDLVLAGRSGNTYRVDGDRIARDHVATGAPSSHVDIVTGFENLGAVPGVRAAVLIGGNTLPDSEVVGRKLRPLVAGTDRLAGTGAQPADVQTAIADGVLTRVGTTSYYSWAGAGSHERVQIAGAEAILRLDA